jgi:Cu/Ag efflux protein CusF
MSYQAKLWLAAALAAAAQLAVAQYNQPDVQVSKGPGQATATRSAKLTATITAIDPATRTVTLKSAQGKVKEVALPDEVRNFDQLKVGDAVNIEYKEALALSLSKEGGAPSVNQQGTMSRSDTGAKPGGTASHEVTITADVVAVNQADKTVTLKGPAGNTVDVVVEDPEQLKNVKTGDKLQAVYTEALAISVTPAAAKK